MALHKQQNAILFMVKRLETFAYQPNKLIGREKKDDFVVFAPKENTYAEGARERARKREYVRKRESERERKGGREERGGGSKGLHLRIQLNQVSQSIYKTSHFFKVPHNTCQRMEPDKMRANE